ncbi:MAG: O-antigen ligase family protein [Bacteroidota bacterium]
MYQKLIQTYPYPLYLLSLCMLLIGMPLSRALMSIGLGVMVFSTLVEGRSKDKIRRLKKRPYAIWFAGLALVFGLSLAYSENAQGAFSSLLMYAPVLIIPIGVAVFPPLPVIWRKRLVQLFIMACLTATGLSMTMGLIASIQAGQAFAFKYFYYTQLTAYLQLHPAYFTLFLGLAVWGQLWWVGEQRRMGQKVNWVLNGIISLWLLAFMFLLASRMQLLAFLLVSSVAGFIYLRRLKLLLEGGVIASVLLLIGLSLIMASPNAHSRMKGLFDKEAFTQDAHISNNSITIRRAIWGASWEVFLQNPILGTGIADVQSDLQAQYRANDYEYGASRRLGPHSAYWATVLATGILGLTYLFLLFGFGAWLSWQKQNPLYLAVLIFFGLSSLTESMLSRQWGIVFFALTTALMLFGGIGQLAQKGSRPVLLPGHKVSPLQ